MRRLLAALASIALAGRARAQDPTHESWQRVELPARVAAIPAGAGGMALAVRMPL